MSGLERMSGLMKKKNRWQWIIHALLALLAIISLVASISNLYGPKLINSWISQVTEDSTSDTNTGMNNMAISNNTSDDEGNELTNAIAAQKLIVHSETDGYEAIYDFGAIKEFKTIVSNFEYESAYEEDSAYNIRNFAASQGFIEGKLTNETPANLFLADALQLPVDLQEMAISSYIYILGTNQVYLVNDAENVAYGLTVTNEIAEIEEMTNNFLAEHDHALTPVVPVSLADSLTYVSTEENHLNKLTYLQERQPNTYFLNHFFETPEDIHDYSLNSIARYYTEGRQLTINMETFEVTLLQNVSEEVASSLNAQVMATNSAIADIIPDQDSWLYAEYDGSNGDIINYRKYVNSQPVFGNNYVAKTQFVMNGDQIKNIYLSSLTIQTQVSDLSEAYTIMSGVDALNLLNNAGYANQDISELVLGYRWVQNPETSRLVELVPSWHVQMGDEWYILENLVDMTKYPSLATSYTETGEPVDLSVYFSDLSDPVSEEAVKTPVEEDLSATLTAEELSASSESVVDEEVSANIEGAN